MNSELAKMGSGSVYSANCSSSSGGVSSSKVGRSDIICPYCRSFESDCKIKMCSQLQRMSLNAHIRHPAFSRASHEHSRLRELSSGTLNRHVPFDLCHCAKAYTKYFSSSANSTRASSCLSTDGLKALRVVLVGILVVLPVSTMSNPINNFNSQNMGSTQHSSGHHSRHHSHDDSDRPQKWINPCRIPASLPTQSSETHVQSQPDEEIFQNIVTQARKAEVQARRFFNDFRRESFGAEHHTYEKMHYDWLKDVADKVGKDLGQSVDRQRLEGLEVADILQSMYRGLQKLAVGLEQVVLDQLIHEGNFYEHFYEAEFQLKYVLCEFQIAMIEKNIQYEDVTREIMDQDTFANIRDKTIRNVRDFTIFRDYLNTLEFIQESFQYFRDQATRERVLGSP